MISVLMILILSKRAGEEIQISLVPTHFLELLLCLRIGEIWQNLFSKEGGISVGNILIVNIEELCMELIYLGLMLLVL